MNLKEYLKDHSEKELMEVLIEVIRLLASRAHHYEGDNCIVDSIEDEKLAAELKKRGLEIEAPNYKEEIGEFQKSIKTYSFNPLDKYKFDRSHEKCNTFINYMTVIDYQKLCSLYDKYIEQLKEKK